MKALILCAGRGERLRPLTDTTPKPLIEVAGKKLIDYNLQLLEKYKIDGVVVNVSYLADKIIEYLGDRVLFSYETKPLGTAGAILKIRPWFDSNFIVLNGDTIRNVNLDKMMESHLQSQAVLTVFTKDTDAHNGGAFIFNYRVFVYLKPEMVSIHEDLIPVLRQDNVINLYGKENKDEGYFDIGTEEKLRVAESYLLKRN